LAGVVSEGRPLSQLERSVILREFRAETRIVGAAAWFLALVLTPAFLALARLGFRKGEWLGNYAAVLCLLCALISLLPLLLRRRKVAGAASELRAITVHDLCKCVLHGGDPVHAVHYVGPHRVQLRPGWLAFWPEGQAASVELCFPPSQAGETWSAAALVSLPGIDIESWQRHAPPRRRGAVPFAIAVAAFTVTVVGTAVLRSSGYWAEAASGGSARSLTAFALVLAPAVVTLLSGYLAWRRLRPYAASVEKWAGSLGKDERGRLDKSDQAPPT
jgi:hypothetical protein